MTVYIALLRGINVGGKNKIKMADLRTMLEQLGLNRVQTYIQSGNILFESAEREEPLRLRIEQKIETVFGFSISVVLRRVTEWEKIIENCPYSEETITNAEATSEGESLYVALLSQMPIQENIDKLSTYKSEEEQFIIVGREIYLLFRRSIRNSKLANNLHHLKVVVTTRNWKTMNKLATLAQAMKE